MSKVLVIVGSPRENGNTAQLAAAFSEGAKNAGHEVNYYSLAKYKVNGCLGCEACMRTGRCVQKDDMSNEIFDKLVECDVVVLATPIYCYMGTALIKSFVERTYPLSMHRTGRKSTVLLSTAQGGGNTFKPLVEWHKANAAYIGWRDMGGVLAGGCGMSVPKRYLDEARKLGENIK